MSINIQRFKADFDKLIEEAGKLDLAFLVKVHGSQKIAEAIKKDGTDDERQKIEEGFKKLPTFNVAYEA